MIFDRERIIEQGRLVFRGGMFAGALGATVLTGCSDSDTKPERSAVTPVSEVKVEEHKLVFDDLDGGSPIIRVYPGVQNTPGDRMHNGTYNDGDVVGADCKTTGREVSSDPSVGETDRTSDQWVRIHGTPGEVQYASAVYVEQPDTLLATLEEC